MIEKVVACDLCESYITLPNDVTVDDLQEILRDNRWIASSGQFEKVYFICPDCVERMYSNNATRDDLKRTL